MERNSNLTTVFTSLLVVFFSFVLLLPQAFAAEETPIGSSGEQGEEESKLEQDTETSLPDQFWYIEESIRNRMKDDPLVVPMFEDAVKAKKRRKTIGNTLFLIGAPIVAASFIVWVAPHDLGIDTADAELYGGIGSLVGALGFIMPGAFFRGIMSGPEKKFRGYMKKKYGVIPVVEAPHLRSDGVLAWNAVHLEF